MADIFSRAHRSRIMARIRSSDTKPEGRLSNLIRVALGGRVKLLQNVRNLPGQPDFYIPSLRLIIFADGCFYHGCPAHGHLPKSNRAYWRPKLKRNLNRDRRVSRTLRRLGYGVWRIWECALKGRKADKTFTKLKKRLDNRRNLLRSTRSI
jgi:DNA mismatch endonuclease (patch repair protein)